MSTYLQWVDLYRPVDGGYDVDSYAVNIQTPEESVLPTGCTMTPDGKIKRVQAAVEVDLNTISLSGFNALLQDFKDEVQPSPWFEGCLGSSSSASSSSTSSTSMSSSSSSG
jgi:hypothetical protein